MPDPRTTPNPELLTENTPARISVPIADLNRHAGHTRDRQVLAGERVEIIGRTDGHCYVISEKDSYVGYVAHTALCKDHEVTHRINALASHAYTAPDFKSPETCALSHGSQLEVLEVTEKFAKTAHGFVPLQHICPINQKDSDFVRTAELFLGTPYLWGGNSSAGIDCSGLVQAALTSCGIPCPGDSDQQQKGLGTFLSEGTAFKKGDLLFWDGHVAIAVDENMLIHANAYNMACVYEPITDAVQRIKAQGDGKMTAHKRL